MSTVFLQISTPLVGWRLQIWKEIFPKQKPPQQEHDHLQPSPLPPDSVVGGERSGGGRQTRLPHPRAGDRKGRRPSSKVPTCCVNHLPVTKSNGRLFTDRFQLFNLLGAGLLHDSKPEVYWQMILSTKQCHHEQNQKMQLFHDQKTDPFVAVACFMAPSILAFWCRKSCFFAWLCILPLFLSLTGNH